MNLFRLLGFVFLGIGAAGVILPLLPATPFILLSAACFARSSERWHRWMLANETFGPMIRNWERSRCISLRVKTIGIASMLLVGGYSVGFAVASPLLRFIGAGLIIVGLLTVLSIKTCSKCEEAAAEEED